MQDASPHSARSKKSVKSSKRTISDKESDDESSQEDLERVPTVDDILLAPESPTMASMVDYDYPVIRDLHNHFQPMEIVMSAIINGCIFGKMCILSEKGNRKWMYNTISLTDTFMVSINKNDVHKMVDRQKKRV